MREANQLTAVILHTRCEQKMGDVKLFNDAGKMPNATKPLKMLKEAIVIMTAAEKDSAQAASEIKKVRGVTQRMQG